MTPLQTRPWIDTRIDSLSLPRRRSRLGRLAVDQWTVGIVDRPVAALCEPGDHVVEWLSPPRPHTFIADPFGLDATSFLCEEFHYPTATTCIVRIEVDRNDVVRCDEVLRRPFHVSYPFVVRDNGAVYVVPEQAASGRVELYEWDGVVLVRVDTLIDGVAALDPTVERMDTGEWLMWFSTAAGGFAGTDLELWTSDSLRGPWRRRYRIVPGVETGKVLGVKRPAGAAIRTAGGLIRPVQDCRETYGGAVGFAQFDPLTGADTLVTRLAPASASGASEPSSATLLGVHTVSPWGEHGERTLIDAKRVGFRADATLGRLRRRIGRGSASPTAAGTSIRGATS